MYKHNASSIIETADKQFVSIKDKQKWDNKAEGEHYHDDTYYSKHAMNNILDTTYIPVAGKEVEAVTTPGIVSNLEVLGDTIRVGETMVSTGEKEKATSGGYLLKFKSHGENMLRLSDLEFGTLDGAGEPVQWVEYARTKEYIPVKPNTTYGGGFRYVNTDASYLIIHYFDEHKKIVGAKHEGGRYFTTTANTRYIRVSLYSGELTGTQINMENIYDLNLMLESQGTGYKAPQHDDVAITIPTPLEGFGNHRDKLFRDTTDNKLKIEKRIKTFTPTKAQLGGLKMHVTQEFDTSIFTMVDIEGFTPEVPYAVHWTDVRSNLLPTTNSWETAPEGIYIDASSHKGASGRRYVGIRINKSRFNKTDITIEDIKEYLVDNNFTIKYATSNPEIIELDDDIMITTANYYSRIYSQNDVQPIIKCKLPSSIKGSIAQQHQAMSILSDRLYNIESMESRNLVETKVYGNTVEIPSSKNGLTKSIKIEGDTTLNIAQGNHKLPIKAEATFTDARYIISDEVARTTYYNIPAGTHVTFAYYLEITSYVPSEKGLSDGTSKVFPQLKIWFSDGTIGYQNLAVYHKAYPFYIAEKTLKFGKDIEKIMLNIAAQECTTSVVLRQCMIVPGKINKSLLSFDNVSLTPNKLVPVTASQLNGMQNLRIVSMGKNMFIPNGYNGTESFRSYLTTVYPQSMNDIIVVADNSESRGCYTHFMENPTGEDLKLKCYVKGRGRICIKSPSNEHNEQILEIVNSYVLINLDKSRKSLKIEFDAGGSLADGRVQYSEIQILRASEYNSTKFQPTVADIKHLTTKSGKEISLYKIKDGYNDIAVDTIEKINGKYYYVKRCHKVKAEELSFQRIDGQMSDNTFLFQAALPSDVHAPYGISHRMLVTSLGTRSVWNISDEEGFGMNYLGGTIQMRIKKSKLNNENTNEAANKWAREQQVEFVYPLREPIYEEIQNIDLQTYDGYTMIQTNSHVAHPTITVVTSNNIQNTVSTLIDKVGSLDNDIEYAKAAFLSTAASSNHIDELLSKVIDNK